MDTFLNIKFNPYLYPFRHKPDILGPSKKPDIKDLSFSTKKFPTENHLYQREQLLQIGAINEIYTNTVFQPSLPQVLHIEKEAYKYSSFQTTIHNEMFSKQSPVFDMPETNFGRPKVATIASKRLFPVNIPQDVSKPCIGLASTDATPEIPMVVALMPSETSPGLRPMYTAFQKPVIALDRPNAMYMDFERSRGMPAPKEVNWTRIDQAQKKVDMIPIWMKVVMGVTCGSIASAVVHPLDVIKVRLQLFPKQMTTICLFENILMCEGVRGLYVGLTAAFLRQLTYTGTRLAVYHCLYARHKETHGQYPNFNERLHIAVVAGLAGAFMGVPSEVALVRMIEVRRLRQEPCIPGTECKKVHRQANAIGKLIRIARREGVATWWRGVAPTLVRSVFVTTTQVGIYSEVGTVSSNGCYAGEIRNRFTMGDFVFTGPRSHFYVAGVSSIFSALLSLPVDQVKTRYQSYQERHLRTGDIFVDLVKKKGFKYLWKGFLPYYARQAVHTMITYVLLDQLIDAYVDYHEVNT